jgi:hypothetical protein
MTRLVYMFTKESLSTKQREAGMCPFCPELPGRPLLLKAVLRSLSTWAPAQSMAEDTDVLFEKMRL